MAEIVALPRAREGSSAANPCPGTSDASESDPLGALLVSTARGDRRAFRRFYELTSGQLLALARRLSCGMDVAEDTVQDTYLRIWRSAHRFDPARGSAAAWTTTILRNCIFNHRDRLARQARGRESDTVLDGLESDEPTPLEQTMLSRDAQRLMACLQSLQDGHREALTLVYYEGLSHAELAERLSVPLGTAKSRVLRGLDAMRRHFGDESADLDAGQYVLGALDESSRHAFELRRSRDARLCIACDSWALWLTPLAEGLPPAEVPDRLWSDVATLTGDPAHDPAPVRSPWPLVAGTLAVLLVASLAGHWL